MVYQRSLSELNKWKISIKSLLTTALKKVRFRFKFNVGLKSLKRRRTITQKSQKARKSGFSSMQEPVIRSVFFVLLTPSGVWLLPNCSLGYFVFDVLRHPWVWRVLTARMSRKPAGGKSSGTSCNETNFHTVNIILSWNNFLSKNRPITIVLFQCSGREGWREMSAPRSRS